jgi:5-methylcytosine-specific restriction endonuclease McrA
MLLINLVPTKRCPKCEEIKPTSLFQKGKDKGGLASYCAACMSLVCRDWAKRNPERAKANEARWAAANPERRKATIAKHKSDPAYLVRAAAYSAAKREQDPERYRREAAEYRARNPLAAREYAARRRVTAAAKALTAAWCAANRDVLNENEKRRQARKRAATIQDFNADDLALRMSVYGGLCAYCHVAAWDHVDHVKPLARGGSHCLSNLRPACERCNLSKGARAHNTWLAKTTHSAPLTLP